MSRTIVVIGGGAAGMAAASRAKRVNKDNRVVVIEKTRYISFALCGIPYRVGGVVDATGKLLHYPPEEFTVKRGIEVLFETEATEIDVNDKKVVTVNRRNGEKQVIEWDKLILATGAKPRVPPYLVNGAPKGVFFITHLDDADRIREYALKRNGGKAVIAGSGYLGLEMAEALTRLGLRVVVAEKHEHVLYKSLDKDIADMVKEHVEKHGVRVLTNNPVAGVLDKDGSLSRVELAEGTLEADMLVMATGVVPNIDLARSIGLKIGETGAVWVNGYMRTSIPDIYSAGDNTETVSLVTGERIWFPFATIANKMGFAAGTNSGLGEDKAYIRGVVGTSTLKVFDLTIASTGLTERNAVKKGFDPVSVVVKSSNQAHYIPGGRKVVLKVIADRDTGRLLGAQAIGDETAFWRVNVIASLIGGKATVWDLFHTDIGYAPPLAPVWDPIIIAGRLFMRTFGLVPKP